MAEKKKRKNKNRRRRNQVLYKNLKCPFTSPEEISYKDVYKIKKFITTRGRIIPKQRTGVCMRCQKKLQREIKKARYMALLPYCNYS